MRQQQHRKSKLMLIEGRNSPGKSLSLKVYIVDFNSWQNSMNHHEETRIFEFLCYWRSHIQERILESQVRLKQWSNIFNKELGNCPDMEPIPTFNCYKISQVSYFIILHNSTQNQSPRLSSVYGSWCKSWTHSSSRAFSFL